MPASGSLRLATAKQLEVRQLSARLEALEGDFDVEKHGGGQPYKPAQPHEFGMYLNGTWYKLSARPGTYT